MNFKHRAILIIGLFCLNPNFTINATNENKQVVDNRTHVVNKGETMYSIASMYNVTVKDMYDANPSASMGIKTGQTLNIPKSRAEGQTTAVYHTITQKETLYSLAREHNMTTDDILAANPGLAVDNFREGKVIIIPAQSVASAPSPKASGIQHVVEQKETLFGISKQYNVSIGMLLAANPALKDGLFQGMTLTIPATANDDVSNTNSVANKTSIDSRIRIGIFLPFLNKSDAQQARFIEYYEGFLLSVEDMKAKGASIDVYTFDIASDAKLEALLGSNDIQDLDLIIGGRSQQQITLLTAFAKKMGVKYVEPFPSKYPSKNDNVYVMNMPESDIESKVADFFCYKYKSDNMIVLSEKQNANKSAFTDMLTKRFMSNGGQACSVPVALSLVSDLTPLLAADKENVIVPNTTSSSSLRNTISVLKAIRAENPNLRITLFGYPDWAAYTQHEASLADFNSTIYTPFYATDGDEVKAFQTRFKRWYGKDLLDTYPKYALYGYDTGFYFMSLIVKYGVDFGDKISSFDQNGLQSPFYFKHMDEGGYVNSGLYFLDFGLSGVVKRTYNK